MCQMLPEIQKILKEIEAEVSKKAKTSKLEQDRIGTNNNNTDANKKSDNGEK